MEVKSEDRRKEYIDYVRKQQDRIADSGRNSGITMWAILAFMVLMTNGYVNDGSFRALTGDDFIVVVKIISLLVSIVLWVIHAFTREENGEPTSMPKSGVKKIGIYRLRFVYERAPIIIAGVLGFLFEFDVIFTVNFIVAVVFIVLCLSITVVMEKRPEFLFEPEIINNLCKNKNIFYFIVKVAIVLVMLSFNVKQLVYELSVVDVSLYQTILYFSVMFYLIIPIFRLNIRKKDFEVLSSLEREMVFGAMSNDVMRKRIVEEMVGFELGEISKIRISRIGYYLNELKDKTAEINLVVSSISDIDSNYKYEKAGRSKEIIDKLSELDGVVGKILDDIKWIGVVEVYINHKKKNLELLDLFVEIKRGAFDVVNEFKGVRDLANKYAQELLIQ